MKGVTSLAACLERARARVDAFGELDDPAGLGLDLHETLWPGVIAEMTALRQRSRSFKGRMPQFEERRMELVNHLGEVLDWIPPELDPARRADWAAEIRLDLHRLLDAFD